MDVNKRNYIHTHMQENKEKKTFRGWMQETIVDFKEPKVSNGGLDSFISMKWKENQPEVAVRDTEWPWL